MESSVARHTAPNDFGNDPTMWSELSRKRTLPPLRCRARATALGLILAEPIYDSMSWLRSFPRLNSGHSGYQGDFGSGP
jgi:hypothetical protein